jgi:hypothetical protein
MIYRLGFWRINEWISFFKIKNAFTKNGDTNFIPLRKLQDISGTPSVSYMSTMFRQDYTLQLLDDLSNQMYKPSQVDATQNQKG